MSCHLGWWLKCVLDLIRSHFNSVCVSSPRLSNQLSPQGVQSQKQQSLNKCVPGGLGQVMGPQKKMTKEWTDRNPSCEPSYHECLTHLSVTPKLLAWLLNLLGKAWCDRRKKSINWYNKKENKTNRLCVNSMLGYELEMLTQFTPCLYSYVVTGECHKVLCVQ